jgi:hypothetical protein
MGVTNKLAGNIVVCRPKLEATDEFGFIFVEDVDSNHPDAARFADIAAAKAETSWKTGLSSRVVQQNAPYLYGPGMTKWGGSVVENGLVVAFSGVEAVFDEAIAGNMLKWIVALCQHEMTRPQGVMLSEGAIFGMDIAN